MKKKAIKKSSTSKSKKSLFSSIIYIRYLSFAFVGIAVILAGKSLVSATNKVHILGTSTGPVFFAKGGNDAIGGKSSEGGNNHGGGNSESGNKNSNSGGENKTSSISNESSSSLKTAVSNNTQVDCIGPDGKHFTTSFKGCSELNNIWRNSNFHFTPLNNPSSVVPRPASNQEKEVKNKTQGTNNDVNKSEGQSGQQGTEVKITTDGNKMVIKAKKTDGTEVGLNKDDALKKINEILKGEKIQLGGNEHNDITIKKGEVEADTKLSVGVDPLTHELTVKTSKGTKTVTVLPDQAVKSLLDTKLFTSIESKVSLADGTTSQKATIIEINNEPVIEVKGISQKKILGFMPVGFAKTAFVSATTGKIVRIDETFLNKVLEVLSF